MSKHWCYTLKWFLDEVVVDEDGEFDPNIADSSSHSCGQQVSETGQQEDVEMAEFSLPI